MIYVKKVSETKGTDFLEGPKIPYLTTCKSRAESTSAKIA